MVGSTTANDLTWAFEPIRFFRLFGIMKHETKAYLFVYGTLRKAYGLDLMQRVAGKCVFVSHGMVSGSMYDLGAYPGAVEGGQQKAFKGEVYQVTNTGVVFPLLDAYEGDDFCRKKTTVVLASGEKTEAYIYWYTGKTEMALLIRENDYLDYLKNKKDRLE